MAHLHLRAASKRNKTGCISEGSAARDQLGASEGWMRGDQLGRLNASEYSASGDLLVHLRDRQLETT